MTDPIAEIEAKLRDASSAIGTVRYMDPPDGGSPTLAEQIERMSADRDALRIEIERLSGALEGTTEFLEMVRAQRDALAKECELLRELEKSVRADGAERQGCFTSDETYEALAALDALRAGRPHEETPK